MKILLVIIRMFGIGLLPKATALLVFFLWLVKSLKKLVNNRIVDQLEKYGLSYDFQYGLGLLDQLQIFWQLQIARSFNMFGGYPSSSTLFIQVF